VDRVKAVLAAQQGKLLQLPYVEGVAPTVLDGESAILVLLNRRPKAGEWLPTYLDGVRVVTRVTGAIQAF